MMEEMRQLMQKMTAGDMPIPTEIGEHADLGVPDPSETVDQVIDNAPDVDFNDIVGVIEANEDGSYPSSHLMTYARLRGKNPTDQELDEFLHTSESPEFLDKDQLMFYGEQFTGGLNDPKDDIEEAFKVIDTNEDNTVEIAELRSFLSGKGANPLNDEELDELFANFDTNKDGKLNLDELKALFLKPMEL